MTFNEWLTALRLLCSEPPTEAELTTHGAVFTHFHEGQQTDYAIGLMRSDPLVLAFQVMTTDVDRKFAQWMLKHRGIEAHRLRRLMRVPVMKLEPVIFADQPDDSKLLIDGSHRYVSAALRGARAIHIRCLPELVWRPYVIDGFPKQEEQALLNSYSNIP